MFEGVSASSSKESRAAELAALPLLERLSRRIVDGERNGLEADLDEAMTLKAPLEIINDDLLAGMKTVGELFGSGQMQLPFVLQSAEVMKTAVAYLEPHMERSEDDAGKGRIVLATVKGDVHDIGKNLVDIILSNNGYEVVNIGIKQPINTILETAQDKSADVVGMSGLLVKSTVVMKENLEEMNHRGVAGQVPGAAGRCGADAQLRGERPGRDLPGRGPLRAGRVRGPAADGPDHERQARSVRRHRHPGGRRGAREGSRAQGAARALETHCRRTQGQADAGRGPGALGCRRGRRGSGAAVLGDQDRQGHRGGRVHRAARRASIVPGAVGIARRPGRRGAVVRGPRRIGRPAPAALLAGPAVHRRHPGARRRGVRLLPGGVRGRRRDRARRAESVVGSLRRLRSSRCARTVPVHVPASAARPVPVHRRLHPVAAAG